jgi:hypothetical protein
VQPQERSLPMGADIGGRHTVTGVITIPTPRHTVALTMATVIITARRITTTTPAPTAGMGVPTARTALRIGGLATILTRERTREAVRSQPLMAAEVQRRPITRTQERTRRRDKVRVRMRNGGVRMCRGETRALPRAITRRPMEQWLVPRLRREEKRLPPVRSGEIRQPGKLPAVTCMPHTMAMFTKTRGTVGRSTTTVVGTR